MKKCIEKHIYDVCINFAKTLKEIDESFLFCYFKEHENAENQPIEI